jgi:dihydroxyacetone kinase
MTTLFNDPAEFAEDQLAGFVDLYADRLQGVPGGVVSHRGAEPIVAVVVGGGSGHYPAFAGLVGPGFASGAVVGNIFTSPSAAQVYSVAKAADQGRGVILTFGNYAGDVMNFGIAAERLRREGIDTRIVLVTDDVASSPTADQRRGIAGDFTVFKALGAAAAAGADIDEVERIGRAANAATRTFGVAFSGCTMPGASEPLFTVPDGHMGVGLGIHGEPGIHDAPLVPARELARMLVDGILAARPDTESARVGVIVNGLGTTKYEELFLLWNEIRRLLDDAGLTPVDVEVGELVTSLDMGGCSLTLMWLDDELESVWRADAYAPGYRKQNGAIASLRPATFGAATDETAEIPVPSRAAASVAPLVMAGLREMQRTLHANETELGRIDAVAAWSRASTRRSTRWRRSTVRARPGSSARQVARGPPARAGPPACCGARVWRPRERLSPTTASSTTPTSPWQPSRRSPTRSSISGAPSRVTRHSSTRSSRSRRRWVNSWPRARRPPRPGTRRRARPPRRPRQPLS